MGAAGTAAAELAPQLSPQKLGSWRRGSWQAAACRAAQLYRQLASCRHSSVNIRLPAQLQLRHWGTDPTLMSLSSYMSRGTILACKLGKCSHEIARDTVVLP